MRFYIRENSLLARVAAWKLRGSAAAIVFGCTIYLWGATRQEFLSKIWWLRHELKHVEQYRRYGFVGFLVRYFFLWLKHGYNNHPLEREAQEAEG